MKSTFAPSRGVRFMSWLKRFSITFVILDAVILGMVFGSGYFLLHEIMTASQFLRGLYGSLYIVMPISFCISAMFPLKPAFFEKEIAEGLFPTFNVLGGDELIVDLDDFKSRKLLKAISWCEPTPIDVEASAVGIDKSYVLFTDANNAWQFAVSYNEFVDDMIHRMKDGIYKGSIILDKIGNNNIVYMKAVKK